MDDLTKLTIAELFSEQTLTGQLLAEAKADAEAVKAELARRFSCSATQVLEQKGKDHGTATLPLQDGYNAKVDVKQTVAWDSAALQSVAAGLPWERVVALFNIKFTMSETIYKGVAALSPELREKIDAARTTKIGEPVVTLTRDA